MQYVNHTYTDYSHVPEDTTDEQPFKGTLISSLGLKRVSPGGKKGGNFIDSNGSILENKTPHHEEGYIKGSFKYLPCPPNRRHAGGVDKTFPQVLKNLLSCSEISNIVTWLPHGRSFIVQDTDEFVKSILPRFFRQSAFRSFSRQLQLWEFRRIVSKGPDFGSYYHELFLRGQPHLMMRMRRRKIKGTGAKLVPNPDEEPDFYALSRLRPLPELSAENTKSFKLPALPEKLVSIYDADKQQQQSSGPSSRKKKEHPCGSTVTTSATASTVGEKRRAIQDLPARKLPAKLAMKASAVTSAPMSYNNNNPRSCFKSNHPSNKQQQQAPIHANNARSSNNNTNELSFKANNPAMHQQLPRQQNVNVPRPYPSAARLTQPPALTMTTNTSANTNISTRPPQVQALQHHQHHQQQQQYVMIPQQAAATTTAYAAPATIVLQPRMMQQHVNTMQQQPTVNATNVNVNNAMMCSVEPMNMGMNMNMNINQQQQQQHEEARIKDQLYARYMAQQQHQQQQQVSFAAQPQAGAQQPQYVLINVPQQQQQQYTIVQQPPQQQQMGGIVGSSKEEDAIAMLSSMQQNHHHHRR